MTKKSFWSSALIGIALGLIMLGAYALHSGPQDNCQTGPSGRTYCEGPMLNG